jgi:hypothetical protein
MTSDSWQAPDAKLEAFRQKVEAQVGEDLCAAESVAASQPTIFHYTDIQGALGILETGTLWFTERAHLNDPIEIQHGLRIGHGLFEHAASLRSAGIPREAASHLKSEHDFGLATYGFWIFSLSFDGNDLAQWRAYADDGRGVCLGFSVQNFDMVELANLIPNHPNSLRFPVSYDDATLRTRMQVYVDLSLDLLEEVNLSGRPDYYEPYGRALLYERDCFRLLNHGFYANSLLHKHAAYGHEQEYRLLVSGIRDPISRCSFHHVRHRKGEIVGYLDLPIPQWKQPGVLTHIRLGPAAPERLKDQIAIVLKTFGLPAPKIDQSDIPFRSSR